MTTHISLNPLKYVAVTLAQMAEMLRDFDMQESAQLLEKVRADIERKLAQKADKTDVP